MTTLPLELVLFIVEYVYIGNTRKDELHTPLAPLSCINRTWRVAVEGVLWDAITISRYYHRTDPDWDDFKRFTTGPLRQQRRELVKSFTLRWIKYTAEEESEESARTARKDGEALDQEQSQDRSDVCNEGKSFARRALLSDDLDDNDNEASKNDMSLQLQHAQNALLASVKDCWDYLHSWQTTLAIQTFRIRLACTAFCMAANSVFRSDNERYLDFLRTEPAGYALPALGPLRVLDVDGSRELAFWPAVLGLRLLLSTPTRVSGVIVGGGPVRALEDRGRACRRICRCVVGLWMWMCADVLR